MLIHHTRSFVKGMLLLLTFAGMCIVLLCPVLQNEYGSHMTGLQYADSVFNSLSKGSSYFVPEVRESLKEMQGRVVAVSVPIKNELGDAMVRAYQAVGADARIEAQRFYVNGDLGVILNAVTDVGDRLYFNDPKTVEDRFHQPALMVARAFWYSLNPAVKDLQRQGLIAEARMVDQVLRRALEPGNNFYSVPVAKVSDHVLLIVVMLAFYIMYTLWYGFGIMELFQGIGLSLHK